MTPATRHRTELKRRGGAAQRKVAKIPHRTRLLASGRDWPAAALVSPAHHAIIRRSAAAASGDGRRRAQPPFRHNTPTHNARTQQHSTAHARTPVAGHLT